MSGATDGLRAAIEALAEEWETRALIHAEWPDAAACTAHTTQLRAALAAHPSPPPAAGDTEVTLTEAERRAVRTWVDKHRPKRPGGWGASVQTWDDLFDLIQHVIAVRLSGTGTEETP